MSRRALFFALPSLLLLGSPVVRASEKLFVLLDYETDATLADCPSESAFRAMVSDQLGYDPFREDAPLKVVARTHADDAGIRGSIEWYDAAGNPRGQRELSSPDAACSVHARALSFAVAVQIQLLAREAEDAATATPPSTATATAPPAPARTNPDAARRPPARDARPASQSPRDAPAAWRLGLGAGPFVALGSSPQAAPGARLFAAAQYDWFALDAGAEATLPTSFSVADGSGFDQRLALGSLAGCVVLGSWSGCVVNKLGRVYVRGFGVDLPRDASGTVALSGARLAFQQELAGNWLAALRLEALATLGSWDVTLRERTVWTTPLVSLSLGIDVSLLFE